MIAAGDTFRAAAVEQLQIWGERAGVPVMTAPQGSDPASLAFDALARAEAEGADLLLIDTAGRLQNREDLMAELAKIVRVIRKRDPEAPHNTLLVLDATTGQNALSPGRDLPQDRRGHGARDDQARRHGEGRRAGGARRPLRAADPRHRRRRGDRRPRALRPRGVRPGADRAVMRDSEPVEWLAAIEGTPEGRHLALGLALFAAVAHAVFGALQKGRFDPWLARGAIDVCYSAMALPVALFLVPWPEGRTWVILGGAIAMSRSDRAGAVVVEFRRGAAMPGPSAARHINPIVKLVLEVGPIAVFFLAYRMAPLPAGLGDSERQLQQILFSTAVFVPTILPRWRRAGS